MRFYFTSADEDYALIWSKPIGSGWERHEVEQIKGSIQLALE
ncbi:MAG: hypothetical protein AB9861_04845 [Methanosarcina sp.]